MYSGMDMIMTYAVYDKTRKEGWHIGSVTHRDTQEYPWSARGFDGSELGDYATRELAETTVEMYMAGLRKLRKDIDDWEQDVRKEK